ncbi:MAG: metallophosphoesterase [Candidatus Obscuribacterales bacterium]|nr:metallophosphoesterase [Candidatus Obscuribacterales bacterium]
MKKILTSKTFLASLSLLGLGACAYAYACKEAFDYSIDFVTIDTTKLGDNKALKSAYPAFKSLKILHISDLHLSRRESMKKLSFLQYITSQDFDLVFLTGDIFEYDEATRYAPYLLSKRPRLGAYAVLGNHDYYDYSMTNKILGRIITSLRHPEKNRRNVEPLVAALERNGYCLMRNQVENIIDEKLSILGIDFPGVKKSEMLTLADKVPAGFLKLALFHMPRDLDYYEAAGIDVGFAGHTHGGQVRIPGIGPLITDSELGRSEACGLVSRGKTRFHISRGLGSDPKTNFRFFCPPVASVIELIYEPAAVYCPVADHADQ